MKFHFCLLLLLSGFFFTGCVEDLKRETQTFMTAAFDEIEYDGPGNIKIYNSQESKVVVEGTKIDLNHLEVVVIGGKLEIEHDKGLRGRIKFEIYTPSLVELDISGSGDVDYVDVFPFEDEIKVENSGSGNIDMNAECTRLRIEQTGSGNIDIRGQADEEEIIKTGSGRFRAYEFPVKRANITQTGSGSAQIQVNDELTVILTGSGNIHYKGHPNITSTITGSGKLIDEN